MPGSMMQPEMGSNPTSQGVCADALARWQQDGWPGPRVEAWRYTRIDSLAERGFVPATGLAGAASGPGAVAAQGIAARVIRFENGVLDPSGLASLPNGLTVSELAPDEQALASLQQLAPKGHPVSTLSLATMTGGIVIDVDGVVTSPLMLLFEGDDEASSTHPAILIRLAPKAHLQLAEWHQSSVGLAAPLIGIDIAAGARLEQVKVQAEGASTTHLAATGIALGEGASIAGFSLSTGGMLARLETHIVFSGSGADCQLSAIFMGRGKQHQDITTYMDHAVAECTSNQIIRGVLDDSSRGVYQGRVHVAPDAQKTDGQQMARALLLSRKAEVDAKPELEIYADDVVCAHGATVGELDATQLFYLTSRGIPYETARAMLIEAFLIDTIETIENDALASLLRPVAEAWLAGGEAA
jgi:Fe-S cluster assembly protein SufD